MKTQQIAGILLLTAILAACADSTISQPETRTPPSTGAAFDTGVGFGSGGRAATDTTSTDGTMGSESTCETDTGVGLGSGGRLTTCSTDPQ